MKLYMHAMSTNSRPVSLLIAEKGLPIDSEIVDLFTGAHYQEPYISLNPNSLVPMLEDSDFRLTESSAIMKYIADKFDLAEYPKDLKARARVNEAMDWINSNFHREFGYFMIYPQVLPHHRREGEGIQASTIEWGRKNSARTLQILNDHWIGPEKQFLCGNSITIADYFASGTMTLGELVGCDLTKYPNITRWLGNVKKLSSWKKVNEGFDGWVSSIPEKHRLVAV